MICPSCGKEAADELSVCPSCGEPLSTVTDPEAAGSEPETPTAVEASGLQAAEDTEETAGNTGAEDSDAANGTEAAAEVSDTDSEAAEAAAPDAENGEDTGFAAEDAAEELFAAEPETPRKKSKAGVVIISVVMVLLIAVIACLGIALKHVSDGGSISDFFQHEKKLNAKAVAVTLTDADGNTLDELTNAQFAYYYWGEYYYFVNNYGFYFDPSTPLDEQTYQEADSSTGTEAMTWQDYFVQNALTSYNQTMALKYAAEAEGFTITDEYAENCQSVLDAMPDDAVNAGFTNKDGTGDVLAYIQESYGSSATVEDFEQYISDSYLVASYSDYLYNTPTYTDDQLNAQYDDNADSYAANGLEKSDVPDVDVRHILIEPEQDTTDEDGNATSSDEAWDAAKEKAEEILQEWKDGDATEDSFAALAEENSDDTGSNTNGGLYEDVYPGEMVTEFNDWCFDSSRQPGDTDIVKTDYGYHIMYFVDSTGTYYWKTTVESDLRYQDYSAVIDDLMTKYIATATDKLDVRTPDAVTELAASYASSNSTGSTAG